jgi:hypothetical protein
METPLATKAFDVIERRLRLDVPPGPDLERRLAKIAASRQQKVPWRRCTDALSVLELMCRPGRDRSREELCELKKLIVGLQAECDRAMAHWHAWIVGLE